MRNFVVLISLLAAITTMSTPVYAKHHTVDGMEVCAKVLKESKDTADGKEHARLLKIYLALADNANKSMDIANKWGNELTETILNYDRNDIFTTKEDLERVARKYIEAIVINKEAFWKWDAFDINQLSSIVAKICKHKEE